VEVNEPALELGDCVLVRAVRLLDDEEAVSECAEADGQFESVPEAGCFFEFGGGDELDAGAGAVEDGPEVDQAHDAAFFLQDAFGVVGQVFGQVAGEFAEVEGGVRFGGEHVFCGYHVEGFGRLGYELGCGFGAVV